MLSQQRINPGNANRAQRFYQTLNTPDLGAAQAIGAQLDGEDA